MDDGQEIKSEGLGQLEEETPPAGTEEKTKKGTRKKSPSLPGNLSIVLSGILKRKIVLLSAGTLLLLGLAGFFFLAGPMRKGGGETKPSVSARRPAPEDGLRQEDFSRFYIPLAKDSSHLVLVVDSSVVWDAISAVRFKKMEVPLRERIYETLSRLFAKEEGLSENIPALEEEMCRILRESLHTEALSVKIREVKVF